MLAFGPFRFFPDRGLLLEGDAPVRVGSRALDILTALVERAGEVVSKEELVEYAWPNTIVVEANLRVHVAGLRKLLGDGQTSARYIASVIGRGYRFVAPVAISEAPRPVSLPSATGQSTGLPAQLRRMVGRSDVVAGLSTRLPRQRFVTIVGPGGIGKTTVAVAVAEGLATSYRDGARFVDLAPVANPALVPSALASALGLAILSADSIPNLVAFLRDKHILIVLDNCEHVIEAAASLAEGIVRAAPCVSILATSREPMAAEGEAVQRLAPLEIPPRSRKLTTADALTFPAVQLFVERATSILDGFKAPRRGSADCRRYMRQAGRVATCNRTRGQPRRRLRDRRAGDVTKRSLQIADARPSHCSAKTPDACCDAGLDLRRADRVGESRAASIGDLRIQLHVRFGKRCYAGS